VQHDRRRRARALELLAQGVGEGDVDRAVTALPGAGDGLGRAVAREPTQVRVVDMGTVDNLREVDPTFESRLYRSIAAILVNRLRTTSLDRV